MDAETLTSKLHEQADKDLKDKAAAIVRGFKDALGNIRASQYMKVKVPYWEDIPQAERKPDGNVRRQVNLDETIQNLIELIEQAVVVERTDAFRNEAVRAFMARVDQLGAEVDELRSAIQT